MPLTPLHLAVALPVRQKVSMKAFIAVNLLMDVEPVSIALFNLPGTLHQGFHTLLMALVFGVVTWLVGWKFEGGCLKWAYGAIGGALSHLWLDALVHSDVRPFYPLIDGNPMFIDAHLEVTVVCFVICAYYLAKWILSLRISHVWSGR